MAKNYSPTATALAFLLNGQSCTVDVFNDDDFVTFGVWRMTEAGPWEKIGQAWAFPVTGAVDLTMPIDGATLEHDTLANFFTKYGSALVKAFMSAINTILTSMGVQAVAADPVDPPSGPAITDVVTGLQATLATGSITVAPGQPAVLVIP